MTSKAPRAERSQRRAILSRTGIEFNPVEDLELEGLFVDLMSEIESIAAPDDRTRRASDEELLRLDRALAAI